MNNVSQAIERAATTFAQMAVVCAFGLAISVGVAGLANTKLLSCPGFAQLVKA